MFLCEEYLSRHKIKVPLIKYVDSGTLFINYGRKIAFDCQECGGQHESNWLTFSIDWREGSYHPGSYLVRWEIPSKSNYLGQPMMHTIQKVTLQWDEYEDYLLDWIIDVDKKEVVLGNKRVVLTAWEMFLYSNDRSIAERVHYDRIFSSIDLGLSIDRRYDCFRDALTYISKYHRDLFKTWRYGMLDECVSDYAYWLGEVVEKHGK